jgi:predicted dehydrogenase
MKIAAIGAGAWGKNIVKNLHGLGALACIVEANPVALAQMKELYPEIPTFEDPADAYETCEFDAVTIAVPAPLHFEIAVEALERGKHAFVEKPITLESRDADALVELAKRHDRILMVGHLLMYQPAVTFIKEKIQEGLIGGLVSIHQERLNLGRARNVENVLWSLGVHDIAVALYLVGETPGQVTSSGLASLTEGIEDDVYVHLDYPSGVQTHLHCSWLWPALRRRTTIIGTNGMLVYSETEQKVYHHKKWIDETLQNVNNGDEVIFEGASEPLRLEMEHFIHCCKTGETPKSDGVSAAAVVKVLEFACQSDAVGVH